MYQYFANLEESDKKLSEAKSKTVLYLFLILISIGIVGVIIYFVSKSGKSKDPPFTPPPKGECKPWNPNSKSGGCYLYKGTCWQNHCTREPSDTYPSAENPSPCGCSMCVKCE